MNLIRDIFQIKHNIIDISFAIRIWLKKIHYELLYIVKSFLSRNSVKAQLEIQNDFYLKDINKTNQGIHCKKKDYLVV